MALTSLNNSLAGFQYGKQIGTSLGGASGGAWGAGIGAVIGIGLDIYQGNQAKRAAREHNNLIRQQNTRVLAEYSKSLAQTEQDLALIAQRTSSAIQDLRGQYRQTKGTTEAELASAGLIGDTANAIRLQYKQQLEQAEEREFQNYGTTTRQLQRQARGLGNQVQNQIFQNTSGIAAVQTQGVDLNNVVGAVGAGFDIGKSFKGNADNKGFSLFGNPTTNQFTPDKGISLFGNASTNRFTSDTALNKISLFGTPNSKFLGL